MDKKGCAFCPLPFALCLLIPLFHWWLTLFLSSPFATDSLIDDSQEVQGPWISASAAKTGNSSASTFTSSSAGRLPNECFYLIVNHLSRDIRALHCLLLVNRFFFHAALPHLMSVLSWEDNTGIHSFLDETMRTDTDGGTAIKETTHTYPLDVELWTRWDQLLLLVLTSFLESRMLERQQQQEQQQQEMGSRERRYLGDIPEPQSRLHRLSIRQEIEAVLEPFGLRLARQTVHVAEGDDNRSRSKGLVVLSPKAVRMLNYLQGDEGATNTGCSNRRGRRKMMVDYSKYFTDLSGKWRSLYLCQLIHLRRLPWMLQDRYFEGREYVLPEDWAAAGAEEVIAAEDGGHEANADGTEASDPVSGQAATVQVNINHGDNSISMNITSDEINSVDEADIQVITTDGDHVIHSDHGISDEEVHTEDQQYDSCYIDTLQSSLTSILFHCNLEHITAFMFDMAKADTYFLLADRMKSLKTISLRHIKTSMSPEQLSTLARFIHLNQSAFPRKAPLNLDFSSFWCPYEDSTMDYRDPSMLLEKYQIIEDALEFQRRLQDYRAAKERRRLHILENSCMRQHLEVYRAIGRPRIMNIECMPMAYEQLLRGSMDSNGSDGWEQDQEQDEGIIRLDRLVEFRDDLLYRMDYGEGPFMERFFRRCHRLQKLSLAAGHPELFSWAAEESLQGCVLSSPPPSSSSPSSCHPARHRAVLPCLQELHLWSNGFYRFSLQVLNDAMTAFAPSLQSVALEVSLGHCLYGGRRHDIPIQRVHALWSLQLRTAAGANTVGDWPFLLPRLTLLHLHLREGAATCIETGTFAQAPNLENLWFSIPVELTAVQRQQRQRQQQQAGQVWQEGQIGVDEEDESGDCDGREEEEQENYMSPHWHGGKVFVDAVQQGINVNKTTLFLPWVLPRLKVLYLDGMPAIRFNFRSLQSMKRLEGLTMMMDQGTLCAFPVKKYMDLQQKTWKSYWSEQEGKWEQGERQEQVHGHKHEQSSSVGGRAQLLQMWGLPELKDLCMRGAAATMFWLDWLTVCPNLKNVTIGAQSELKIPFISMARMPFFFSDGTHLNSSSGKDSGSIDMEGDRSHKKDDDVPLLNSQLSRFELTGAWAMSQQDLIRLMTVYAPFLQQFRVDRIRFGGDGQKSGYQLLKAIMDADHINQVYVDRWYLAQQYPVGDMGQAQGTEPNQTQNDRLGQDQQEQRMPGSTLIAVLSDKLAICKKDKALLKLSTLTKEQSLVLKVYPELLMVLDKSVRVYTMKNQSLVRKQDLQAAVELVKSKLANSW
ncbi:hypothetical protein EDD11_005123 [Mortierella claussenii]|nr:hypothetical protein EDD11_005123 [Mortierella claussenii]